MATLINPLKPKAPSNQPAAQAPAAPAYMGMGQSAPQASTSTPKFTNLQQFLAANTGAGERLAGRVLQQKGSLESAIGAGKEAATKVGTEAEAETGRIKTSGEQASEAIKSMTGGQQYVNPEGQATDEFKGLYSGQVNPELNTRAVSALGQTQQSIQGLQNFGQKLGTETGRTELLGGALGKTGGYGSGLSTLDQIFLQRGGGGQLQSAVKDIRKRTPEEMSAYQKLAEGLTGADTGTLSKLGKQATDTQGLLQGTLTGEQTGFETAQQEEAARLSGERSGQYNLLSGLLSGGLSSLNSSKDQGLSEQERARALIGGAGLNMGMETYGLRGEDLSKYFTPGQLQLTNKDVVSPEELARYKALSSLSGMSPESLQYKEAGKFGGGSAVKLDNEALQSGLEQAKQNYLGTTGVSNVYNSVFPNQEFRSENPFSKDEFSFKDLNTLGAINTKYQDKVAELTAAGNPYPEYYAKQAIAPELMSSGLLNAAAGQKADLRDRAFDELRRQIIPNIETYRQQAGLANTLGGLPPTGNTPGVRPRMGK